MIAPNLVLKYTIDGDSRIHVRGAMRIKVDGSGVTLYRAEDGKSESVNLGCIRSLTIQAIPDLPACATSMIQ
jgi:hypothetical protein